MNEKKSFVCEDFFSTLFIGRLLNETQVYHELFSIVDGFFFFVGINLIISLKVVFLTSVLFQFI